MDSENTYDFEAGDEMSDLEIIVEDKTLRVHQAILATASPVFRKMLSHEFKESQEKRIRLPDKTCAEITELLKFIYPNFIHELDDNNVYLLLELSEEYDIYKIKLVVEKHLVKKLKEMSSAKTSKFYGKAIDDHLNYLIELLDWSTRFRLKTLKAECLEHMSAKFDKNQLEKNANFKAVDAALRLELFSRKVDLLEEKLKQKEKKLKQAEDELTMKKFEIQRLGQLLNTK